jgi:hypothetical protein
MSHRKRPVLCACHGSNSVDGSQHNSKQASTLYQEHYAKNQTTPQLFGHSLGWDSTIACVRYDIEHSLQRIVFVGGKHTQPSMHTLLHGMETQSHTANQIEWSIFTLSAILRFVVASAAEAEVGALFLNCKQATIF